MFMPSFMALKAPSSLCPGYKQVEFESFGLDEEYEDEEMCYVTLDMGNVEPTLVPSSSSYQLIMSAT
jgi:general transcription factor 3C polypeptide 6